jgi:MarR family transcriptional regulator for hemolysin
MLYKEAAMEAELLQNVSKLINRASRALTRLSESKLKALGFAMGQIPVLVMLKDGSARSQTELAQFAGIEQPSMAQMLARMERDGLILRQPDPEDGRSSQIVLTAMARQRLPAAREILVEHNQRAVAGLTTEEAATLARLLGRVLSNLEGGRQ